MMNKNVIQISSNRSHLCCHFLVWGSDVNSITPWGDLFQDYEFHNCVYVYRYVNRMGPFYQCFFSIKPTEQEAVAHFVPHKMLFNGIRWGQKKKKKIKRCADSVRAMCALTYTLTLLKQTL